MKILFPYMARWYAVNWTRYHSLLSALAADGYEVHVIQPPSLKSSETNYQEIEPRQIKNIHIHDVPLNKTIWNFKFPFDKLFKKAYFSLASYKYAKELNKKEKFDILLVYNIPQLPYCSLIGPTKVFDYADDYVDMLKYELGKLDSPVTRILAKSMLNKMFKKSSLIMSVSHELTKGLTGNVKVIPNGVSLDKANKSLETEILEINNNGKPVVGFVGSFEYFIDLDLILDVALKMPNLHFLMVGTGRDMEHVKERINKEGIKNIQLTGGVPHEHIFGYINKMDICLNIFKKLPVSHRACPIKLFEYLSQKKPVISTRLHELKYIDKEFIYYADSTEEAVAQINTILNGKDVARAKALCGYEITKKKYTWEVIARRTSKLLVDSRIIDIYGEEEDLRYLPDSIIDIIEQLPGILGKKIKLYFPDIGNANIEIIRKPMKHSTYPVLRYLIKAENIQKEVYIKFAPVNRERNEGLTEYQNLVHIQNKFEKCSQYGSPRPLDFIGDINALVTEGVRAITLKDYLLKKNHIGALQKNKNNLKSIIKGCGGWLKEYHETNNVEWRELDDDFKSKYHEAIGLLKKDIYNNELIKRLEKLGNKCLSRYVEERIQIPESMWHGDLALDNILVEDKKIYILDVEYNERQYIYYDIAQFIINIETINYLPRHMFYDLSNVKKLQKLFLSAYNIEKYGVNREILLLFLICEISKRYKSQNTTALNKYGAIQSRIIKSILISKYTRIILNIVREYDKYILSPRSQEYEER